MLNKLFLLIALILVGTAVSAQDNLPTKPGIQQKTGWDPCFELDSSEAVENCIFSSGTTTECACSNGSQCDQSIVTADGKTLVKTGCYKGTYFGVGGLKCYYYNPSTRKNEERFIKC